MKKLERVILISDLKLLPCTALLSNSKQLFLYTFVYREQQLHLRFFQNFSDSKRVHRFRGTLALVVYIFSIYFAQQNWIY